MANEQPPAHWSTLNWADRPAQMPDDYPAAYGQALVKAGIQVDPKGLRDQALMDYTAARDAAVKQARLGDMTSHDPYQAAAAAYRYVDDAIRQVGQGSDRALQSIAPGPLKSAAPFVNPLGPLKGGIPGVATAAAAAGTGNIPLAMGVGGLTSAADVGIRGGSATDVVRGGLTGAAEGTVAGVGARVVGGLNRDTRQTQSYVKAVTSAQYDAPTAVKNVVADLAKDNPLSIYSAKGILRMKKANSDIVQGAVNEMADMANAWEGAEFDFPGFTASDARRYGITHVGTRTVLPNTPGSRTQWQMAGPPTPGTPTPAQPPATPGQPGVGAQGTPPTVPMAPVEIPTLNVKDYVKVIQAMKKDGDPAAYDVERHLLEQFDTRAAQANEGGMLTAGYHHALNDYRNGMRLIDTLKTVKMKNQNEAGFDAADYPMAFKAGKLLGLDEAGIPAPPIQSRLGAAAEAALAAFHPGNAYIMARAAKDAARGMSGSNTPRIANVYVPATGKTVTLRSIGSIAGYDALGDFINQ